MLLIDSDYLYESIARNFSYLWIHSFIKIFSRFLILLSVNYHRISRCNSQHNTAKRVWRWFFFFFFEERNSTFSVKFRVYELWRFADLALYRSFNFSIRLILVQWFLMQIYLSNCLSGYIERICMKTLHLIIINGFL